MPAPNVPRFRPFWGSPPSLVLTKKKPTIDATMPMTATASGRKTPFMPAPLWAASSPAYQAAPRIIEEMIVKEEDELLLQSVYWHPDSEESTLRIPPMSSSRRWKEKLHVSA